jgi:hypothetical protein
VRMSSAESARLSQLTAKRNRKSRPFLIILLIAGGVLMESVLVPFARTVDWSALTLSDLLAAHPRLTLSSGPPDGFASNAANAWFIVGLALLIALLFCGMLVGVWRLNTSRITSPRTLLFMVGAVLWVGALMWMPWWLAVGIAAFMVAVAHLKEWQSRRFSNTLGGLIAASGNKRSKSQP